MLCHDFLVGGNDVLAERYALEDVVECGLLAAHDLYDDVHIWVVENIVSACGERVVGKVDGALPAEVSHERAFQRYRSADHLFQLGALACYNLRHAAADHAHAQQSYSYGVLHRLLFFLVVSQ